MCYPMLFIHNSRQKNYNITLLPGDGIGPEVISDAKNVLNLGASIEGLLSIYFIIICCYSNVYMFMILG